MYSIQLIKFIINYTVYIKLFTFAAEYKILVSSASSTNLIWEVMIQAYIIDAWCVDVMQYLGAFMFVR